jgi:hypothetical protein
VKARFWSTPEKIQKFFFVDSAPADFDLNVFTARPARVRTVNDVARAINAANRARYGQPPPIAQKVPRSPAEINALHRNFYK